MDNTIENKLLIINFEDLEKSFNSNLDSNGVRDDEVNRDKFFDFAIRVAELGYHLAVVGIDRDIHKKLERMYINTAFDHIAYDVLGNYNKMYETAINSLSNIENTYILNQWSAIDINFNGNFNTIDNILNFNIVEELQNTLELAVSDDQ